MINFFPTCFCEENNSHNWSGYTDPEEVQFEEEQESVESSDSGFWSNVKWYLGKQNECPTK